MDIEGKRRGVRGEVEVRDVLCEDWIGGGVKVVREGVRGELVI